MRKQNQKDDGSLWQQQHRVRNSMRLSKTQFEQSKRVSENVTGFLKLQKKVQSEHFNLVIHTDTVSHIMCSEKTSLNI